MASTWITALKIFNEGKPSWCVPRKGTADYGKVKDILEHNKPENVQRRRKQQEETEAEEERKKKTLALPDNMPSLRKLNAWGSVTGRYGEPPFEKSAPFGQTERVFVRIVPYPEGERYFVEFSREKDFKFLTNRDKYTKDELIDFIKDIKKTEHWKHFEKSLYGRSFPK